MLDWMHKSGHSGCLATTHIERSGVDIHDQQLITWPTAFLYVAQHGHPDVVWFLCTRFGISLRTTNRYALQSILAMGLLLDCSYNMVLVSFLSYMVGTLVLLVTLKYISLQNS